jgi:ribosome-associated heat shock protein Hsp15
VTQARIDKWLFCARLCRTRETAQDVVARGRIRLNGARIDKPARTVRPGDILTLALGGQVRVVRVLALAERRGGAGEAPALYEIAPE